MEPFIPRWQVRESHRDGPCNSGCSLCEPDSPDYHEEYPQYYEPPSNFDRY
jgi:hypothetical protein